MILFYFNLWSCLIFKCLVVFNFQSLTYKCMQLKRVYQPFIHCTLITVFTVGVNLLFSCAEVGAPIQLITAKSAGLIFDMVFQLHQVAVSCTLQLTDTSFCLLCCQSTLSSPSIVRRDLHCRGKGGLNLGPMDMAFKQTLHLHFEPSI